MRLLGLLLVFAVGIGVAFYIWWQQVPTEDDLKEAADLKGKHELFVGVKDDMPGVGLRDPVTGRYSGFDIDISYLIAADLGFRPDEVRFLTVENEDRSRMRAQNGDQLDLVIATYSSTEEREKGRNVSFTDPYLDTEQSVLTLKDHPPVLEMTELRGRKVCTLSTSTSRVPAAEAGADVVFKSRISDCLPELREGRIDAVTTDAAILAGFVAAEPTVFRHHDIGLEAPELWAVNTGGNEALRKLVNLSLYRSLHNPEDKRWEDAFDRHLRPMQAASNPQTVATDRQPDVEEVEVRLWPWERLAGVIRPMSAARPGRARRAVSSGR